jgi:hypothetical protein
MKELYSVPKYRINFVFDESRTKFDSMAKSKLFDSIEIAVLRTFENAERARNSTF